MERKELNERLNLEYNAFKDELLQHTKEEIFERGYEINFKTYIKEYFANEENEISDTALTNLSLINGSILDELFSLYIQSDTYYTYDEICEEIIELYDEDYSESEE